MARGAAGRFAEMVRNFLSSERLDELPEAPVDPERISFVSRLLTSETLPFDEGIPAGGVPHRKSGVFASEDLPLDERPEARGGRTPFVATLFSREPLPVDPAPGPGPTGRDPRR